MKVRLIVGIGKKMNKALKRFKRIKWRDTNLSRYHKTRVALFRLRTISIKSLAMQELQAIAHSDMCKSDKVIARLGVTHRTIKAINKLV